jgi:hypothetical protein
MRATRRAQNTINRLLVDRRVTAEGIDWLTLATDPFHDTDIRAVGYPDLNTCNSITQCFTLTQTIRAPPTASGGIWDAHVFLNPISRLDTSNSTNQEALLSPMTYFPKTGEITAATANGAPFNSGYNVVTYASGLDYNTAGATPAALALAYPRAASNGQYRLVSAGFEIVNTTPVLQRGGSITSYRQPSHTNVRSTAVWYGTGPNDYAQQVNTYIAPPLTQSLAQLIPTSKTWGAEEGVYSTATQSTELNPFLDPMMCVPLCRPAPSLAELTPLQSQTARTIAFAIASGSRGGSGTLAKLLPYDIHGAFLTGLSPETTLQVTVKYYVERVPTTSDADLLVLSRPSPQYDPMAIEIYSRAMAELPVGVKVGENPLGEWFNDVLDVVAEFAPSLGSVLGPMGSAAGLALGKGAKTWRDARSVPSTSQFQLGPAPPVPPRRSSRPKKQTIILEKPPATGRKQRKPRPKKPTQTYIKS